jgi:hypothetical protein
MYFQIEMILIWCAIFFLYDIYELIKLFFIYNYNCDWCCFNGSTRVKLKAIISLSLMIHFDHLGTCVNGEYYPVSLEAACNFAFGEHVRSLDPMNPFGTGLAEVFFHFPSSRVHRIQGRVQSPGSREGANIYPN